jgi:hypothetical protein
MLAKERHPFRYRFENLGKFIEIIEKDFLNFVFYLIKKLF